MKTHVILGIETSCDDTSVCLLNVPDQEAPREKDILFHERFSQEILLAKWGGVVPEIAARNHLVKLFPLIEKGLSVTGLGLKQLSAIAVTTHPGLLGPLLTGLGMAKHIALVHHLPLIAVNHLYAHLEAIHLTKEISYPYLGLLVSGGHSLYLLVKSEEDFEILGTTSDDAAGEAFDKAGKLLGLTYPAGREIDELAQLGNAEAFDFPIGLKNSHDAMLSFSGVKTSLRVLLEKRPDAKKQINDLCASYQKAIIDALCLKLRFALQLAPQDIPIVVGGGVACNSGLRKRLQELYGERAHFVAPKFCTDNGAMIAHYGSKIFHKRVPYPKCLEMDAFGKFIDKKRYT